MDNSTLPKAGASSVLDARLTAVPAVVWLPISAQMKPEYPVLVVKNEMPELDGEDAND